MINSYQIYFCSSTHMDRRLHIYNTKITSIFLSNTLLLVYVGSYYFTFRSCKFYIWSIVLIPMVNIYSKYFPLFEHNNYTCIDYRLGLAVCWYTIVYMILHCYSVIDSTIFYLLNFIWFVCLYVYNTITVNRAD